MKEVVMQSSKVHIMVVLFMCMHIFGCIGNKSVQKLYVINVLSKEDYNDCHIAGSIHVPFEKISQIVAQWPRDSHIVVYCSNYRCAASGIAVKELKKLGFLHIWAYEGGIAEWFQQGKPVKGSCKQPYLYQQVEFLGHDDVEIPVISAQELEEKIAQMAA